MWWKTSAQSLRNRNKLSLSVEALEHRVVPSGTELGDFDQTFTGSHHGDAFRVEISLSKVAKAMIAFIPWAMPANRIRPKPTVLPVASTIRFPRAQPTMSSLADRGRIVSNSIRYLMPAKKCWINIVVKIMGW